MPPRHDLLPPNVPLEKVAACLGLVSDTHAPDRLKRLPPSLFEALEGVDLLLHAGDVGELWVLDELSALAPVIAVSGNDGAPDADRELPVQQLVCVAGTRILLLHSHLPDPEAEMAARRGDEWGPKLDRRAEAGRRAGAAVVVFGHTHIPLAVHQEGVLLVNPGALAPPNARSRQLRQTVALLWVLRDAPPAVVHVDLAVPRALYDARVEWEAGFAVAAARYGESILAPELAADVGRIRDDVVPLAPALVRAAWMRAAHRVWGGELAVLTHAEVAAELRREPGLAPDKRARLEAAVLGVPQRTGAMQGEVGV